MLFVLFRCHSHITYAKHHIFRTLLLHCIHFVDPPMRAYKVALPLHPI